MIFSDKKHFEQIYINNCFEKKKKNMLFLFLSICIPSIRFPSLHLEVLELPEFQELFPEVGASQLGSSDTKRVGRSCLKGEGVGDLGGRGKFFDCFLFVFVCLFGGGFVEDVASSFLKNMLFGSLLKIVSELTSVAYDFCFGM